MSDHDDVERVITMAWRTHELANALQSVVLIAERLEQQAASVSLDTSEVIKGFRRATTALNAVRAADHGSE